VPIRREPLPEHALHAHYQRAGAYADCYAARIGRPVSHEAFVTAFYTTWLFKLERLILRLLVNKPSTDAEAGALARGERSRFAAWTVEARTTDQIVMCDFLGRTRSWLMVEAVEGGEATRLYFGSVVVPKAHAATGKSSLGASYTLMLGFHKLYSRALLRAARARLFRAR
jgi:hypothetical protein